MVTQSFLARLIPINGYSRWPARFWDGLVQLPLTYFVKTPGGDNGTLSHQDGAYRTNRLEPMDSTIWIILDESTPENSCLHMLPNSYREDTSNTSSWAG